MNYTTNDIAKIAGVSQSTVSRSLNNSPLVSDETKNRIKKLAMELGFEFNANARSLSTSKIGTIGIIYPEDYTEFSVNLYFSSLHNQLRESLEREEIDLIASFPSNKYSNKSNIRKLITCKKVDGLIIIQSDVDRDTLDFLKGSKIPFIFLHHYPEICKDEDVDIVYVDHFRGGYLATEHLIKKGHTKIVCITAVGEGDEYRSRTEGYKKALNDYQIEFNEQMLLFSDLSFQTSCRLLLEEEEMIKTATAIFAQTDLMALGAIEALRELQIKIPEEIAVVGYNDEEIGQCFRPHLTSIHQPRETIACLTCERLIELINSNKVKNKRKIVIEPKLIIRESSSMRCKKSL